MLTDRAPVSVWFGTLIVENDNDLHMRAIRGYLAQAAVQAGSEVDRFWIPASAELADVEN